LHFSNENYEAGAAGGPAGAGGAVGGAVGGAAGGRSEMERDFGTESPSPSRKSKTSLKSLTKRVFKK